MNEFLKAVVKEIWDLEQAGLDVAAKKWDVLVTAAIKCGMDLPGLISSVGSAKSDLEALLSNPAADADLLAYIVGMVGSGDKAAKVICASADLALSALEIEPKVIALVHAIKA